VDPKPQRQQAAREVGIDSVGSSPDEVARPGGWDTVIDCTGAVEAVEDGLNRVRRGGTFQQFGVAPSDARAKFSPFRIYNDELTVVGSMAVLHSYGRAVEMFVVGALNAKAMVSHAYVLADYAEAIEAFRAGTGRKIQIRPQARESMELL
jgi:threonine dehydrogenase-like Zn-dependent dehydrogenase